MVAKFHRLFVEALEKGRDIPILLIRLLLAYGFYGPAMKKLEHFDNIIKWFDGMGIPFPTLNAYMATGTEIAGFILLALGLATRYISIPLMVIMVVAIKTVHWEHGFSAGDNGFEIPLYYMIMLLGLVFSGGGRLSVDHLIARFFSKDEA